MRDVKRGAEFANEIERSGGRANVLALDVSSFASVRAAAERFRASYPTLDVLVNLVALTHALLPALEAALEAAPEPRVINVGSSAHNAGRIALDDLERAKRYTGFEAHAQSKLALNLYTREFAARYPAICANVVHPGAIATDVWRGLPAIVRAILGRMLPSAASGAAPLVRLATSGDVRGVSGRYFDRLRETAPSESSQNPDDARRLWAYAASACAIQDDPAA